MTYKKKVLDLYPDARIKRESRRSNEYTLDKYGPMFIVSNGLFNGFGSSKRKAWKDAWTRIENIMLRKLES